MEGFLPVSLSQYTAALGNALRLHPELCNVWVTAELTDVGVKGGHCYMVLIEKDSNGVTVAKMRATIWSSTYQRLRMKFMQATQREISTGIKVLVLGSATHHSLYGLSFNIIDIDPSYTLGDLERLRREILMRLEKEGVAGYNKSLKLPAAPQRIAVISSGGAAGYGDFINQLEGNSDGFVFYPVLFEATMQGERTAPSILSALDRIEMTIDLWDCVVIIRGGGATTDMNGFDDYALAHRVCTFRLPVIVGIGHERDRNVLDELACVRCKTPTAVAGFLIDTLREAWNTTARLTNSIIQDATARLEGENIRLSQIQSLIPSLATNLIAKENMRLSQFARQLPLSINGRTAAERGRIEGLKNLIATNAASQLARRADRLEALERLLSVLSPSNTIKRGYAIARVNGRAVKSVADVTAGQEISIQVIDGEINSKIL